MPDIGTALTLRREKPQSRKFEDREWSIPISSNAATHQRHMQGWAAFANQPRQQDLPELYKPLMSVATAEWYAECAVTGVAMMRGCIDVNPNVRGGRPVLKGTGFTVSWVLAELAETDAVDKVADRFSLSPQPIRDLLGGLSLLFERSYKP